ncbi:hypothetical protein M3I53_32370 [Paraburkholderia sp. CNPSo 3272]|uniref:hypothetical protein n=1 Tax=Paraburkholderia sp. CNPSo 3272 TaxID=2940931 RepID=UPI0020B891AB|nr:hypothetical protein [Paraburkholderia sp. CNPSo 3272]MCP3727758.1 hypothetical protein [Paraburkholderia sp. CNPSo 3272]
MLENCAESQTAEQAMDVAELHNWIEAWYHHSVLVGYIQPMYVLDNFTAHRLENYFCWGLTPCECADVMFGNLH